jgi:hypothetical protein
MAELQNISTADLKGALIELSLAASPFIRRGNDALTQRQQNLIDAINTARAALSGKACAKPITPEEYFTAYLLAGGNWQELVAKVNRFANSGEAMHLSYQARQGNNHAN